MWLHLEYRLKYYVLFSRVEPLYQHVICTTHASLSFIGLPWQVIPFPLMELQSKWVARVLSGHSQLPSRSVSDHT